MQVTPSWFKQVPLFDWLSSCPTERPVLGLLRQVLADTTQWCDNSTGLKRTRLAESIQEAASPVQEVTPFGKDAVLGDPEAQCRAERHHGRQQEVEVLPECSVTQQAGSQIRQDHQHCVEEHLEPEVNLSTGSQLNICS